MLHLIAYDIGHPRRLRRVAKICANYGVRMEKSVFECDLTDEQMAQFWNRLCKVVDEDEDTVTVNYYYAEEDDDTGNTETVTVYYIVEA